MRLKNKLTAFAKTILPCALYVMGNGVVPMEAFDRRYRETVGRICCNIAKQAEEVIRIVCGIPIVLKK